MSKFLEQLAVRKTEILSLLAKHIELTIVAVLIAVVIGVPLGIFITKNKKVANIVINILNTILNKMFCSDITPIAILLAYPKGFKIIYSPDILVINVTNIPITPTDIGIKKDLKKQGIL